MSVPTVASASAFTIMKHHSCSSAPRNCDWSACAMTMSKAPEPTRTSIDPGKTASASSIAQASSGFPGAR